MKSLEIKVHNLANTMKIMVDTENIHGSDMTCIYSNDTIGVCIHAGETPNEAINRVYSNIGLDLIICWEYIEYCIEHFNNCGSFSFWDKNSESNEELEKLSKKQLEILSNLYESLPYDDDYGISQIINIQIICYDEHSNMYVHTIELNKIN